MGDVAVHIMSDLPPQLDLPPALPEGHSDDSSSSGSSLGSPASLPPAIPPALLESVGTLPVPFTTGEEPSNDVDESVKNDENVKSDETDTQSPNVEITPHESSTPSESALPALPSSSTSASGVGSDLNEKSNSAAGSLGEGDTASNSATLVSDFVESSQKASNPEITSLESSEPENSVNFPKPVESAVVNELSDTTTSQDVQQAVAIADNALNADKIAIEGQEGQDTVSQPTETSGDVQEGAGAAVSASEDAPASDAAIVVEDPTPPPNPLDLLAISTAPKLSHVTASRAKGPAGGRRPPTRGVVVESKPQSEPDRPMDTSRLAEIAFSSPIEPVSDEVATPSPESMRKQKHISLGQPMMKFDVTAVKLKPSNSNPAVQAQEAPEVAPAMDFRSMLRTRSSSNSDLQKGMVTKKPASALPPSLQSTPPTLNHASSSPSLARPASLPPLLPDALPAPIPGGLPPALATTDLPPSTSDLPAPMPSALPPSTPDSQKKKGKATKMEKSSSHKEVEKAQKDAEKAQKKAQKEAKAKETKDGKKKRHTFSPTSSAALAPAIQASAPLPEPSAPAALPAPLAALPPTPAPKADTTTKKGIASFLTGFFKSRPKRESLVEKGLLAPEEPTSSRSAVASSSAPPPLTAAPPPPLAAAPPPPLSNLPPTLSPASSALPSPTTPSSNSKKAKLESKASKRISVPSALPAAVPPPIPSAAPPPLPNAAPPPLPNSKPPPLPGTAPPPLPNAAPPPLSPSAPSALPPPIPGGPPQAKLPSLPPPMSAPPKGPPPSALPPPLPYGPPPSLPPALPPPGKPTH